MARSPSTKQLIADAEAARGPDAMAPEKSDSTRQLVGEAEQLIPKKSKGGVMWLVIAVVGAMGLAAAYFFVGI